MKNRTQEQIDDEIENLEFEIKCANEMREHLTEAKNV